MKLTSPQREQLKKLYRNIEAVSNIFEELYEGLRNNPEMRNISAFEHRVLTGMVDNAEIYMRSHNGIPNPREVHIIVPSGDGKVGILTTDMGTKRSFLVSRSTSVRSIDNEEQSFEVSKGLDDHITLKMNGGKGAGYSMQSLNIAPDGRIMAIDAKDPELDERRFDGMIKKASGLVQQAQKSLEELPVRPKTKLVDPLERSLARDKTPIGTPTFKVGEKPITAGKEPVLQGYDLYRALRNRL